MSSTLKIFAIGGTIDKIYFDGKGQYQIGDPEIGKILDEGNIRFSYDVTRICQKDSLDMNDSDRQEIRKALLAENTPHILLTHGTDTMIETAKVLLDIPEKTIVLTGSMQPAKFKGSDATFNVGFAVAAALFMPPGVYIAMNGQLFDPLKSRKNVEQNCFEILD